MRSLLSSLVLLALTGCATVRAQDVQFPWPTWNAMQADGAEVVHGTCPKGHVVGLAHVKNDVGYTVGFSDAYILVLEYRDMSAGAHASHQALLKAGSGPDAIQWQPVTDTDACDDLFPEKA